MSHRPARRIGLSTSAAALLLSLLFLAAPAVAQRSMLDCSAERPEPLVPTDLQLCEDLEPVIRDPSALPLEEYEAKLGDFLRAFCHRNTAKGWVRDKSVRDTGPFIASLQDGEWVGSYYGTHAPVVIWYSEEMIEWLEANRPVDGREPPAEPEPIPDGAVMIKEMYPHPAAACADVEPVTRLLPTSGAAVMVRDRDASHDGWFWGWFGWSGWDPDYPPGPTNRYPYMGFGQYCMNCHASAEDNLTFADLKNVNDQPGQPLVFLSQDFFEGKTVPSHHRLVALPSDDPTRLGEPLYQYSSAFTEAVPTNLPRPTWDDVRDPESRLAMPSETYDNVWVQTGGPSAADEFLTSSQCLGCHDAGGTGIQFDMTRPNPHGDDLLNLSPYGTWRTSPMGLGGRDPIFYAMLASETDTFHPDHSKVIQDTCLGCHGILGQRQFAVDQRKPGDSPTEDCKPFLREYADAVPFPDDNPEAELADYGALARDGISCTACHHMRVGENDPAGLKEPQNHCLEKRQEFLNPESSGFAKTFTGSFQVGPPDELYGPFPEPKVKPMDHAMGVQPVHNPAVRSSELCGTCHTVHLPVLVEGVADPVDYTYEQTTYPEWAFSAYRTGETPEKELPEGAGPRAESCQSCHMPSKDDKGPFRSKIAGIQEYTNFPQAENALPPVDIDLQVRGDETNGGFAYHTLVGLNVFFVKMAQQFPDVLGIRTQDPMLVDKGLDPLIYTEQAMLDQASHTTATVEVGEVEISGSTLSAKVTVTSRVGHKFPSGVGFRRAFLEFAVLDENEDVLWASGRTDGAGVLVDAEGDPVAGELWWQGECASRLGPGEYPHQPHYTEIRAQNQVQIYQELVTAPMPGDTDPDCGLDVPPVGPFTTSFLSICGHVKDNRILPHGFLDVEKRTRIAKALGAGDGVDLARDAGPHAVGDDPDYVHGGGDSLRYVVDLAEVSGRPAAVRATLYYQAIPPFFLQDRFCTSRSDDTKRLYFLAGHLNLDGTAAEDWKLEVVSTGAVRPLVLLSR